MDPIHPSFLPSSLPFFPLGNKKKSFTDVSSENTRFNPEAKEEGERERETDNFAVSHTELGIGRDTHTHTQDRFVSLHFLASPGFSSFSQKKIGKKKQVTSSPFPKF